MTFINKPLTLSTPKEKEEEEEEEKEEGTDMQITVKGRTRIHTVGSSRKAAFGLSMRKTVLQSPASLKKQEIPKRYFLEEAAPW